MLLLYNVRRCIPAIEPIIHQVQIAECGLLHFYCFPLRRGFPFVHIFYYTLTTCFTNINGCRPCKEMSSNGSRNMKTRHLN